jgi:hypothetical protein
MLRAVGRHVVMFSGGEGSALAAKRVVEQHGAENTTLLFCDTKVEDADLYRFRDEVAAHLGAELVTLADGRTIWDVFRDERFLGNARVDPCSRVLKRELADAWIASRFTPETVTVYVGIDWTEEHRYTRLRTRKLPYRYDAPLCEPPMITRHDAAAWLASIGIARPRLTRLGFAHNNCGGGCVKAGVGHFAHLYRTLPDVFAEWERNEQVMRDQLGDVSILRDRSGGTTRPLTLAALRTRLDDGYQPDLFEIGGCGCFIDTEAA